MDHDAVPRPQDFFPEDLFRDQRAVVTGGATGLGKEISLGLARLGARVAVLSRNPDHHAELARSFEAEGLKVRTIATDVRESSQVHAAAEQLREDWGGVDVLVNNAAGNFVCPTERMSANAWRAVLGIVLDGTFYCSREFGRMMIDQQAGVMLNIVATYAWTGQPGVAHSASAKAGVLALTKTLAAEWAPHRIRVNAIAPGPFESEGAAGNLWPSEQAREAVRSHIPLGRFASAEEVALHSLYLLSPACGWVTGECLVSDGGTSLPPSFIGEGRRPKKSAPAG